MCVSKSKKKVPGVSSNGALVNTATNFIKAGKVLKQLSDFQRLNDLVL